MLRRLGLAIVFFACVWALGTRTTVELSDGVVQDAAEACARSTEHTSTGDSDGEWRSARVNVSITESVWKTTLVHADLAGVRLPARFWTIAVVSADDRARPAPRTPLRIPLLI